MNTIAHRPTEVAAIAAAARSGRPLPSMPVLFAALVTAYATRDRHGLNLFAHAIARKGGEVGQA
ncbi:hypothetical protein QMK19_30510 [Streptomyces sp. H10-C2]|uniref:hypothetical protein n=1 Tax=unclassified Streptomyces TaxID=2593676 RepID=UPI0024B887F3|nr:MULTISPECIES: hypothetical protein [unclassified Streptomyces]MDJ0345967.1 hypothetical protein [Streptomyces sp. PH10-H1]MDJ0373866.1 hypothetical protein [Streptomyces sp. H10-C2]